MKEQIDDVAAAMRMEGRKPRRRPVFPAVNEAQQSLARLAGKISDNARHAAGRDVHGVAVSVVDLMWEAIDVAHTYGFAHLLEEMWSVRKEDAEPDLHDILRRGDQKLSRRL